LATAPCVPIPARSSERHGISGHVGRKEPLQPEKPGSVNKSAIKAKQRWQIGYSHI
jgi:hypothetical protein